MEKNIHQPMNQDEAISVINKAIEITRYKVIRSGKYFLLWGVLSLLGAVASAILPPSFLIAVIWMAVAVLGWIGVAYFIYQDYKLQAPSPSENSVSYLWAHLGVAIAIVAFVASMSGLITYSAIIPLIMILLWVGVSTTAVICRLGVIKILAQAWLLAAVLSMLLSDFSLVIYGIALVLGLIIPGVILVKKESEL